MIGGCWEKVPKAGTWGGGCITPIQGNKINNNDN